MKLSPLSKKGQVNTLAPTIIAMVIAGVFLVLGVVMLQEMRDTNVISRDQTSTVNNETLTAVTDTGEYVDRWNVLGFNSMTSVTITNATGGETIESGNYTASSAGLVINLTSTYAVPDWNISYTYSHGGDAWIAANDTTIGIGSFADFIEIIVLAIVITVVIGLLLIVFGRRTSR